MYYTLCTKLYIMYKTIHCVQTNICIINHHYPACLHSLQTIQYLRHDDLTIVEIVQAYLSESGYTIVLG